MTKLTWTPGTQTRGTWTTDDGVVLAEYVWNEANNPYLDRIRPLAHRGVLNNHAPWDHRWHHGLWWSWKFVNDILFWEDHPDYGGNRKGLGHSMVVDHQVASRPDPVVRQSLSWRVDASDQELLTEVRTLRGTLTELEIDGQCHPVWALDWDLSWTAAVDLHMTTTPYPEVTWGGYAGLNFRPARSLVDDERILAGGGPSGAVEGAEHVHGNVAAWASYTGHVDGAGDDHPRAPAVGGVAILQHPANPGFPGPVYAATAVGGGFGFLAAAPLMRQDRTLSGGDQLRLRYRTLLLDVVPNRVALENAHGTYAREG